MTRRQSRLRRIALSAELFRARMQEMRDIECPTKRLAAAACLLPRAGHRIVVQKQRKHNEQLLKARPWGNRAMRRQASRMLFA